MRVIFKGSCHDLPSGTHSVSQKKTNNSDMYCIFLVLGRSVAIFILRIPITKFIIISEAIST